MFDLTGKTALVTGATGGIGGAIASALHAQGATVAVSGRQADKLEALASELGDRVHVLPCDLANAPQSPSSSSRRSPSSARLDILVNNAGLTRDNLFMVMKDEQWDEVIAVNLTSTFMLCRAAARAMLRAKTGFGRIINIASVSGVFGNPGQGNYAASKAGMIGMTKSLAREVAPRGITANCIAPGFVTTPMTAALNEKQTEEIAKMIPSTALSARPRRLRQASSISPATRPATSPARRCISTAAWPWSDAHGKSCIGRSKAWPVWRNRVRTCAAQAGARGRWPRPMKCVNEPNGFSALGTSARVNEGPMFGRRTECELVG